MKGGSFISSLALLALFLSACVHVDISEDATPLARYAAVIDWGLPEGVQATADDTTPLLYIALARTTQTVHDTCHLCLPKRDTHTVAKGNYHAIAFGGSLHSFYRVDNYDTFLAWPQAVGLSDISLLLPQAETPSQAALQADPQQECLEFLRQSAPFPPVQQAQPIWIASDHRMLEGGDAVNMFCFNMQKMIQELTLRIRIDYNEQELTLEGLALALNGVPRRLNLLSGSVHHGETVSSSADRSDIGTILSAVEPVWSDGKVHFYECKLRTLGLFSPASEVETGAWGVVEIAVKVSGKNVMSRKVNLYRLLRDHPVMTELGAAGDYRIAVSSAKLDISSYAVLSISSSSDVEDDAALEMWSEEGDDHHLPLAPEDE